MPSLSPLSSLGETERNLRSRFGERLRSIRMRKNTPKLPVAQHFNSTGHSISDFQVGGELRVFLQLGTVQT